jgi:putative membrane protein
MESQTVLQSKETKSTFLINAISIAVPVAVAVLLSFPNKLDLGAWTKNLPHAIGAVNTITTLALVAGLIFIKQNKIEWHRWAMTLAFALGGLFLVFYVTYHLTNPANKFGGEGAVRYVYFFILISHVLLSLVVLPLVLRAMFFAVTRQFARHKRIVKYAYPIWLYVSATGVAVYFLVNHLYPAK